MSMKIILCQWRKLNLLKIQKKKQGEEADEDTKQECSASDKETCTVEKVAVVAKGEPAKDFKIGTNKRMKKYLD